MFKKCFFSSLLKTLISQHFISVTFSLAAMAQKSFISPTQIALKNEITEESRLLTEILSREEFSCGLLVLYDHSIDSIFMHTLQNHYNNGLVLVTLEETSNELLSEMSSLSRSDGGKCIDLVILSKLNNMITFLRKDWTLWQVSKIILIVTTYDDYSINNIESILLQTSLRKTANVVAAERRSAGYWILSSLLLYHGEKRQSIARVNTWTEKDGFRSPAKLFKDKMIDLGGYDFSVAALPYSIFVMNNHNELSGPGKYIGVEIDIMDLVVHYMNATYHFVAPEDGEWGRINENGTWTGMIGMVVSESAEWAMSDISYSYQRQMVIDFGDTLIHDAQELITPRAKPLPRWLAPVRPFSYNVWICVVVLVALAGPLLSLLARLSLKHDEHVKYFTNVGATVMYIMQHLFQKGNTQDITVNSCRVFVAFWLIFSIIIGISYSSSLTSFLIAPGFQKPIENLKDLVASDVKWSKVYFGGVQQALLRDAKDIERQTLFQEVIWGDSLDNIIKQVVKGELATWDASLALRFKIALQYSDENGQPLVHLSGFPIFSDKVCWPMQKNSPILPRYNQLLGRIHQAGLVDKIMKDNIAREQYKAKLEDKKTTKANNQNENNVVLSLDHFQGPFAVIIFGWSFGLLMLFFELLSFKLFKNM